LEIRRLRPLVAHETGTEVLAGDSAPVRSAQDAG